MITTTMNREEILKEFNKFIPKQYDVCGKKCDKLFSKAKIKFRQTKEPVYVGNFKIPFGDNTFYCSTCMNFPKGTRNKSEYYSMLVSAYTILVSPGNGKKIAMYINPKSTVDERKGSLAMSYSLHFLKRFYERRKGADPEGKTFEFLAEYYFKERGYGVGYKVFPDITYKDYPGPIIVSRNLHGIELGWIEEETEIFRINTFISEEMLKGNQVEDFGEDSEIYNLLLQKGDFVKNAAPPAPY